MLRPQLVLSGPTKELMLLVLSGPTKELMLRLSRSISPPPRIQSETSPRNRSKSCDPPDPPVSGQQKGENYVARQKRELEQYTAEVFELNTQITEHIILLDAGNDSFHIIT